MKARYALLDSFNEKEEKKLHKKFKNQYLFLDFCSAAIPFKERLKAKELLNFLNTLEGFKIDYLSIASIDQLGKNLHDILRTIKIFDQLGITIKIDNLGIESLVKGKPNEVFSLLLTALDNIFTIEKQNLSEVQKRGIAIAKANGSYKGRVKGSIEPKEIVLKKHKKVVATLLKGKTLRDTAKICKVSLGTVQKVKKLI
ncbi:DNA invertase Pin-like site-specific DNA recombinase [Maribacter vaceletii]|uniref:DNA invertase Pin-like site-specific DNA recombinase n=1 Tax=Maribacter vaceletii TaxID=1206816 RepID=A0A495E8G7_9FLAO|nr:recombinase family protein [Maribacter vaceletii]RKR13220.1 DNA invertase Pin-like site-specific DNA recombinase [Maribacter vaceletii]